METKSGCAWIALTLLALLLGACENFYRGAADDPQLTVTIPAPPAPVSSGVQRVAYAVAPAMKNQR